MVSFVPTRVTRLNKQTGIRHIQSPDLHPTPRTEMNEDYIVSPDASDECGSKT